MVKLKFIGHRILTFAIIAAIVNVYAFEYWCNVRLAAIAATHSHGPVSHSDSHHLSKHDHAATTHAHSQGHEHAAGDQDAGCCQDETDNFFSSLQASGISKIHIAPLNLPALLPVWLASFQVACLLLRTYGWPFHPDVGLRPKIPDIRIFLCSLTI